MGPAGHGQHECLGGLQLLLLLCKNLRGCHLRFFANQGYDVSVP